MTLRALVSQMFTGPRLYRLYSTANEDGHLYVPNTIETCGDNIIRSISVLWSATIYTSPIIIYNLLKRDYFNPEGLLKLSKVVGVVGIILFGSIILRGFGRYLNPVYQEFVSVLEKACENVNTNSKLAMGRYEFDFSAWPVEFQAINKKHRLASEEVNTQRRTSIRTLPCQFLSYLVVHTIGRRMIYPGSVSLLQYLTKPALLEGRKKLIEHHKGERFKVETVDGNQIDTMFVDRRNKSFANGDILVICCEGNAGFYEYGIMVTPLEAGYSVLGWNHPGFAGSTGLPYPAQEHAAVDAIMQLAEKRLGFPRNQTIIFAWSIGAYTGSYAAMTHPDIKGLILDATFDDILPLAVTRMPPSWKPLVVGTVRDHMNLVNIDYLIKYHGPVRLIRRTQDEIISTSERSPLKSNRGNNLLIKLLRARYPKLFSEEQVVEALSNWLSSDRSQQVMMWNELGVDGPLCATTLRSYGEENLPLYPMLIGQDMSIEEKHQMALFLAVKYLDDYESTHCTPLPGSFFRLPWDITSENQEEAQ